MNTKHLLFGTLATLALSACAPPEDTGGPAVQYVEYESGASSDSSDAPVVATMCEIGLNSDSIALLKVKSDSAVHPECEVSPFPYSSSYYETSVEVVETLFGTPKHEFVLTTLHEWGHRRLSADDLIIASLRESDGAVFGVLSVGVRTTPSQQAGPSSLPTDLNVFRARAADVKTDFAGECPEFVPNELTAAEFTRAIEEPEPVCSDDPFMP